jgi:hypothetical protein
MTNPNPSTLDEILSADDGVARLNVDLDKATYDALKAYARSQKKTLSCVVRVMIQLHLFSVQAKLI